MENKITYRSTIQSLIIFSVLSFSFFLSGYRWFLPYFVALWGLLIIFEFNFVKRFKESINKENYKVLVFQILFFIIILFGFFHSENKVAAIKDISQKFVLLILPVFFVFSGNILKKYKYWILKLFILSNIIFSIACIIYATYMSIELTSDKLIFNPIIQNGNRFYYIPFSFLQHPSYFSMYIVMALASMFHLKDNNVFKKSISNLVIYYTIFLFFLIIIYMLSSRAGIISAMFLSAFRLIQNVFRYKRLFFKIVALTLFLIAISLVVKNPRVLNIVSEVKETSEGVHATKSFSLRIVFWTTAIEVIDENFWIGTGNGDSQEVFNQKFKKSEFAVAKYIGYNVHNQYLQIFMTFGVVGFVTFLLTFIFAAEKAIKEKNQLFLIFLFSISFNFLFETMLNTLAGVFFFSFFLNYFLFVEEPDLLI